MQGSIESPPHIHARTSLRPYLFMLCCQACNRKRSPVVFQRDNPHAPVCSTTVKSVRKARVAKLTACLKTLTLPR